MILVMNKYCVAKWEIVYDNSHSPYDMGLILRNTNKDALLFAVGYCVRVGSVGAD
jgi:hypothetical protein